MTETVEIPRQLVIRANKHADGAVRTIVEQLKTTRSPQKIKRLQSKLANWLGIIVETNKLLEQK